MQGPHEGPGPSTAGPEDYLHGSGGCHVVLGVLGQEQVTGHRAA